MLTVDRFIMDGAGGRRNCPTSCLLVVCSNRMQRFRIGERSRRDYADHLAIDSASLLVRVVNSFDHERDTGVTLTYQCHVTSNVTHTSSCHASVVINDVNDEAPHIKFSNSTTAKYDRLAPIEITGQVRRT